MNMDKATRTDWDNLRSQDGETRYQAFMRLLETEVPKKVRWFMENRMTDQRFSEIQIIL